MNQTVLPTRTTASFDRLRWVCGFALLWHFILFDLLTWVTGNYFPRVTALPELTDTETLVTVLLSLLSLLGLWAMRTAEKFGGGRRGNRTDQCAKGLLTISVEVLDQEVAESQR